MTNQKTNGMDWLRGKKQELNLVPVSRSSRAGMTEQQLLSRIAPSRLYAGVKQSKTGRQSVVAVYYQEGVLFVRNLFTVKGDRAGQIETALVPKLGYVLGGTEVFKRTVPLTGGTDSRGTWTLTSDKGSYKLAFNGYTVLFDETVSWAGTNDKADSTSLTGLRSFVADLPIDSL